MVNEGLFPKYSIEKYKDGTMIIFVHSSMGILPYLQLSGQTELKSFIKMLEGCVVEIPEVFKRAMGEN